MYQSGIPGFLGGIILGCGFSAYVFAMYKTTVANTNFIISLQILFLAIFGFFFLKEIFVYAPIIKSIYLGALYIVLLSLIITKSWKISLHMLAVGGATGVFLILEMLFGQSQNYLMFFIFLAGVVGFARYSLKAHDLKQIYTGFILGLCIMCISIIYL